MSTFGVPTEKPPRWVAALVVAASAVGAVIGLWAFAVLT